MDKQTGRQGRGGVLPPDVSDVFMAGGVAGVPVMAHRARRVGRGRLAVDRGLVILSGLQGGDRKE